MGLAALAACDRTSPVSGPEPAGPVLEVEFAGCAAVVSGPVCRLATDAALVVWARSAPDARIEVRLQGGPSIDPAAEIDGGFRFAPAVPWELPATVTVTARRGSATRRLGLELVAYEAPEWLTTARTLVDSGRADRARELLTGRLDDLAAGPRARALGLLARIDYRAGRSDRAEEWLRAAVVAHREAGNELGVVDDTSMLAFVLQQRRAVDEARALVEALDPPAVGPAEALYYAAWHRGVLARNTGDLRAAVRWLGAAADHAWRAGLARERLLAQQPLATTLERIGRHEESANLFATMAEEIESRPELLSPCQHGQVLNNHGFHLLLAREAEGSGRDPRPLFDRAVELFDDECDPAERYNVRVNLAFAEALAGRPEAARGWLEEADRAAAERPPEVRMRLWRRHVDGLVAIAAGEPESALAAWERLATEAGAALLPELSWRAELGRATALEHLGREGAALDAYARAEAVLERESLEVALQGGRQTFVARRERGTRRYVDRLLTAGRVDRALEVARRAGARVVRGVGRRGGLAGLLPEERAVLARAAEIHRAGGLDASGPEEWGLPGDLVDRLEASRAAGREALRRWVDDLLAGAGAGAAFAESVPEPPPGTVLVAFYPLPEGWAVFALDTAGVVAHRTGSLKPFLSAGRGTETGGAREGAFGADSGPDSVRVAAGADSMGGAAELYAPSGTGRAGRRAIAAAAESAAGLAGELFGPIAAKISQAQRVRLLTYGDLAPVDLHALPFGGAPLLAGREVEYGLDLGPLPEAASSRRALVVGDPTGDLPGARAEALAVESALTADGWTVTAWTGESARAAALPPALAGVDLFHYAGHAEPGPSGAWRSRLALAGGGLAVEDVLTLEGPPAAVVLSGCETGGAERPPAGESLGLAHAFLVAGSRWVIATSRPIPDRHAAAVVAAFYDAWTRGDSAPTALGRAQLALARADPEAPWASFRLIRR